MALFFRRDATCICELLDMDWEMISSSYVYYYFLKEGIQKVIVTKITEIIKDFRVEI